MNQILAMAAASLALLLTLSAEVRAQDVEALVKHGELK
jgi:hypothetical protein